MNIIYIHTHDSGRFLSPYGFNTPTDNILNLAKDSTLFRQAHCVSPTCSPSRVSLLTSTYPHNNGMLGLAHRGFEMTNYNHHLANYLKKNKYETVLCGMQHEALVWRNNNEVYHKLGYDINLTLESSHIAEEDLVYWDLDNANEVSNYIKKNKNKKFFISFGMHATHRKYPKEICEEVDERYMELPSMTPDNKDNRNDFARFYTSAKFADRCVGKIIDTLKKENLYDKTLIIFTTDHGIANPFYKCNLKDTGTGVSLIIRNPKSSRQGKVIDALVSHLDVFPTICDILELEKPDWIEGNSLINLMDEKVSKVRDEVFGEVNYHTSYEPSRSIRTERYKYIKYFDDYDNINYSNIDDSNPKDFLLENGLKQYKKTMEAFYDLYYDPCEGNNLINNERYSDIINELKERLYEWQVRTEDPILKGHMPVPKGAKINKNECISPGSKDRNDYEYWD